MRGFLDWLSWKRESVHNRWRIFLCHRFGNHRWFPCHTMWSEAPDYECEYCGLREIL